LNERKNSIIIVDDDESIRKTLAAILEQEGYDVETAGDGAKAILKSNEKLFDIALVDMRLPDMLGTELLGRIKERVPKTAKIMVTGYPTMQNAIQAVNEGADGYIVKPVEADVLLETIRKHLKRREEAAKYSEGKVVDFLETRKKELALKAAADRAAEKS
jgi:DNA-binding NtrC family response regulator